MRIFLIVVVLILPSISYATKQIDDVLEFDSKEYKIEQTPLSALMSEESIVELIKPNSICSASWRGYKAKWKIENKVLYFVELKKDPCGDGGIKVPKSVLFPGSPTSVKAVWYSGTITSPTGKWWGEEKKHEEGYTVIENYKFERETFEITDGILIEKRTEVVKIEY